MIDVMQLKMSGAMIQDCPDILVDVDETKLGKPNRTYPIRRDEEDTLAEQNLELPEEERVSGSGYVVNMLLATLWCLCTTDSYESCVLREVNLVKDTDGRLCGIHYGYGAIPKGWRDQLIRREQVEDLCDFFSWALPCAHVTECTLPVKVETRMMPTLGTNLP